MSAPETKYKAFHRIGAGGYGAVFLGSMRGANDVSRRVAIKRLHSIIGDDVAASQRFDEEAQLLSRLDHPNIVSILDYYIDKGGCPSLVMEYVDGCNLADLVAQGACSSSVAVYIAVEILRALGYLHRTPSETGLRGLVHRDVSPQNVLLSWSGTVFLSDFGISKVMDTHGIRTESFRGKAAYASPEQLRNQAMDGRSDLFALGVVLWEMIAGRSLFHSESPAATIARVLYGAIPSLSASTAISPELEAVLARLLERDVTARYDAAGDVIRDLLACAEWPRSGRDELMAFLEERRKRPLALVVAEAVPRNLLVRIVHEEDGPQTRTDAGPAGSVGLDVPAGNQAGAAREAKDGTRDVDRKEGRAGQSVAPLPSVAPQKAPIVARRFAYGLVALLSLLVVAAYLLRRDSPPRRSRAPATAAAASPVLQVAGRPAAPALGAPAAASPPVPATAPPAARADVVRAAKGAPDAAASQRRAPRAATGDARPTRRSQREVDEVSRYRERLRYVIGEDGEQAAAAPPERGAHP
jgi:eukaryotic-like serine/threonine-protein kinase